MLRVAVICTVLSLSVAIDCPAQSVKQLIAESGIQGGLIVHVGCDTGQETIELAMGEGYVVQGLDAYASAVAQARRRIAAAGLSGTVSAEVFDGEHLPYIDNLVNLLVVDSGDVSQEELLRVLRPGGVARIWLGNAYATLSKPWPEEIDEWTHYLHGPDNNAVAADSVIDSPRRLQWSGGPKWSRSHEKMSSMNAMVSAEGRIFYVMDEGPSSSVQLPPEWKLVARDAFNGVILWRRDIPQWHTHLWPLKAGPAAIPRRLVAVGDRVYITLGLTEPVVALDAATGETVKTYEGTEGTEEILVSDETLYLRVNEDYKPDVFKPEDEHCWTESTRAMGKIGIWTPDERQYVTAIDADSGKELWRFSSPISRLSLTVDSKSVYFHSGQHIACLDRATGEERWRQDDVIKMDSHTTRNPPTLVSYDDVLLYQHNREIRSLAQETGKVLWKSKHPRSGHVSPGDALVINDLVWSAGSGAGAFIGKDIHTGEVKADFTPPPMTWFHPRCYRSKGTERFLLASRTGIEVVDVRNKEVDVNHWTRGSCLYGIMPANGLIYVGPHPCACLMETKTSGFNALAPASPAENERGEIAAADRLTKGPAYDQESSSATTAAATSDTWPMYRHDPARSGCTRSFVPTDLKRRWSADIGTGLHSLVSDGNLVITVVPNTLTIHALHADTGEEVWQFVCGGRIDSPPTIQDGKLYFGSHDGYVYCLRESDGELVWKYLAATNDRRMVSYGQVESVWPVHGSVLVMNGAVYCVAGRSAFLDDGLRFHKLDARSGELLAIHKIDEVDPESGENLQKLQGGWVGLTMPVANPDILSSDGEQIFMRSQPFDMDGKRLRIAPDLEVASQNRPGMHLFSPVGLLDSNWNHRSYWVYGVTAMYGWHYWFEAAKFAPSGRILAFDDDSIYGFGRKPQFWAQSPTIEYQLYKADKRPIAEGEERVKKTAAEHKEREWNQTQWLSRGKLYKPDQLTALNYHWINTDLPIQVRAMVLTKDTLFVAGLPDVVDEVALWHNPDDDRFEQRLGEQAEALRGNRGGSLWAVSLEDGSRLSSVELESPPVFDGMIAAGGRLYLSLMNGQVLCLGE